MATIEIPMAEYNALVDDRQNLEKKIVELERANEASNATIKTLLELLEEYSESSIKERTIDWNTLNNKIKSAIDNLKIS